MSPMKALLTEVWQSLTTGNRPEPSSQEDSTPVIPSTRRYTGVNLLATQPLLSIGAAYEPSPLSTSLPKL